MECARKRRSKLRKTIQQISSDNPAVGAQLRNFNREEAGRPRLEVDMPYLHDVIINLVATSGAADARRRSELVETCRTLDELITALRQKGFQLSRSGLYLR